MKRAALEDRTRIKRKETSKVFMIVAAGMGILMIGICLFLFAFFKRSWSESADRNILLVPEVIDGYKGKILFAHISPSNHQIDVTMINPELSVNVIGGYGNYPIRSVFPLLSLDKKDEKMLPGIYSFALNKVVDEVWRSDKNNFNAENPNFRDVVQKLLLFKIASNLTLGDRIWLYRFTQSLRSDELRVKTANTAEELQKIQADIQFADQSKNCNFAVVNTISISGVGTQVGKMLENSGFSIVRITDQEPAMPQTQLVLGDRATECQDQQDHTLHAMPLPIKVVQDLGKAQQYRANMVLFIGADMKPFFENKN